MAEKLSFSCEGVSLHDVANRGSQMLLQTIFVRGGHLGRFTDVSQASWIVYSHGFTALYGLVPTAARASDLKSATYRLCLLLGYYLNLMYHSCNGRKIVVYFVIFSPIDE